MKRMDEVFELPVAAGERDHDEDDIFQAGGNGVWCATFCSDYQAKAAAHAINHVDELADALEALLKELDLTCIGSANLSDRIHDADAVLAAYRGEK